MYQNERLMSVLMDIPPALAAPPPPPPPQKLEVYMCKARTQMHYDL